MRRVFKPVNTRLGLFLNGFKISDIDQLIPALMLRFGLFWSKKLDVKFSRVVIRYKDTLLIINFFLFFSL